MKRKKEFVFAVLMTAAAALLIIHSGAVSAAALTAIKRCVNVIIPSLFAFMAISKLIVGSGAVSMISKPFDLLFGKLLRLPKGAAAVFLISNLAGYPVGASMLKEMTVSGQTDRHSAEIMLIYCFSAGPAFIISAVGIGVFGSEKAGVVILLSVLSANMLLAAAVNRVYKPKTEQKHRESRADYSELLINSVTDTGEALFSMCLIIVFFSMIMAAADVIGRLGLSDNHAALIRSVFEVTNLAGLSKNSLGLIPFAAALTGFGGVCVLLQIKAVVKDSYSLRLFLLWTPIKAILIFCFAKLYTRLLLDNYLPASTHEERIIVEIDNLVPSLCLIMMIFLLVFKKRVDFF